MFIDEPYSHRGNFPLDVMFRNSVESKMISGGPSYAHNNRPNLGVSTKPMYTWIQHKRRNQIRLVCYGSLGRVMLLQVIGVTKTPSAQFRSSLPEKAPHYGGKWSNAPTVTWKSLRVHRVWRDLDRTCVFRASMTTLSPCNTNRKLEITLSALWTSAQRDLTPERRFASYPCTCWRSTCSP